MSNNAVAVALVLAGLASSARAQQRHTLQVQALGTVAPEWFAGAGLGFAVWPSSRSAVQLTGTVGRAETGVAARAEAMLAFHLNPFRPRGIGPYAAGGAAVVLREGGTAEYLLLIVGIESRPGARRGWFAEAGVGGGLRAALGVRLRR